jgi:hypothetical protein
VNNSNVLLWGENAYSVSLLLRRLERSGCQCWFTISEEEALQLLSEHQFRLVLNVGPWGRTHGILSRLRGTHCDVYATYPIEDGCLWLQLLDSGRECSRTPALRPSEFAVMLDDLFKQAKPTLSMTSVAVTEPRHWSPMKVRASALKVAV